MPSLARVINDMIVSALLNAQITSSGGDSPKFNHVTGINQIRELDWETLDEALNESITSVSQDKDSEGREKTEEQQLADIFKGNTSKAKELLEYVTDPTGKMMSLLTAAGPAGILFGSIIIAAFKSDEIMEAILDQMTAPGSPFDRRLKIFVQDGVNAFFTRMEQRQKDLGLEHQIFTQISGFGNFGGALTTNNLVEVSRTGVASMGIDMKSLGVLR